VGVTTLHAKIGELTLVNDFFVRALGKAGRRAQNDRPAVRTRCR
jgi:hypothetical protein